MGPRLSTPLVPMTHLYQSVFDRSIKHLYDSRPMSGGLPIQINPLDLAHSRTQLEGRFRLAEMSRLAGYSPSESAEVRVRLMCEPADGPTLVKLVGEIIIEVQLQCERCLGTLSLPLNLAPEIYFASSGRSIEELDERDIIAVEGPIDLRNLVEEEILLALPMMPMHQPDQCEASELLKRNDNENQQTDNPFAKLAKLKEKNR